MMGRRLLVQSKASHDQHKKTPAFSVAPVPALAPAALLLSPLLRQPLALRQPQREPQLGRTLSLQKLSLCVTPLHAVEVHLVILFVLVP